MVARTIPARVQDAGAKVKAQLEELNNPRQPSLLERERDVLAAEQGNLINMRQAIQRQEEKINAIRHNIGLMEDHPWIDGLYQTLRERETPKRPGL